MADLISRAAAIEYLMINMGWHDDDGYEVDDADEKRKVITDLVDGIPAVDAVPVVRCRDCKHGEPTHNARGEAVIKCEEICWLCRLPRLMEPDWFCADGERRED